MNNAEILLSLTRLGIGHRNGEKFNKIDWLSVQNLAEQQGIYAIVLDGIEKLPEIQRPPQTILLEWIGEVLQGYEYRYKQYCKAISEMACFYNNHGYRMMVMKGYACSLEWPKPEHRPCGDIDIWLFGEQKETDTLLESEKGIKIDNSHHHHTVFNWNNFMVENHYDFVNTHDYQSSSKLEKIFKELGQDDTHYVGINSEKIYLPSPNLHALFLLRHAVSHFTSTSLNLRQVLDWAFYVRNHTNEINWKWLNQILDEFHMIDFFNCLNGICVEDLGFSPDIFCEIRYLPSIKEKMLKDIFSPEYTAVEPNFFISRLIYKYKRWRGNAWKRKICYEESDSIAFVKGLWYHILKPSSL